MNELLFEDQKGSEQIYIHAERDFDTVVENDRSATVRGNTALSVDHNRLVDVGGDDHHVVQRDAVTIIEGNAMIAIGGNQAIVVGGGVAADPQRHEVAERLEEITSDMAASQAKRAELEAKARDAQRTRDAKAMALIDALEGDDAKAGRILIRQTNDRRKAAKKLDHEAKAMMLALERLQDDFLAGHVLGAPPDARDKVGDLHARVEQAQRDLRQRIHANATTKTPISELQALAADDMEQTLTRLEATGETVALAGMFVDGLLGMPDNAGGAGAPPAFAKTQVQFNRYYQKPSAKAPSAALVNGHKLDVNGAALVKTSQGIRLECPGSAIELTPGGINITSTGAINIEGATVNVKGTPINLN